MSTPIIYDDNAPRTGGFVNYYKINANAGFLRHMYNLLTLQWIRDHSENFRERAQCDQEILITERKVAYHKKHPNFNLEDVEVKFKKMKNDFQGKPTIISKDKS